MRILLLACLLPLALAAQQPTPRGACVLAGGGKLPPVVFERFLELAGGEGAQVVLVPTASQSADRDDENADTLRLYRERLPGAAITLLHTRDRAVADSEAFCAPLRTATGVWFTGGDQSRLAAAYLGTRCEREVMAVLARGGVIGGTSAGTAIQTRVMIAGGMDPPEMATGFDCVPGAISDQHFLQRERLPRLLQALALHPGLVGIGVDEGTAAIVRGDDLDVVGVSKIVLALPAWNAHPESVAEFAAGSRVSLACWRCAATDRAAWQLPAAFAAPRVAAGTLVLGGRSNLRSTAERLLQLAGGADASVVVFSERLEPWESPLDLGFTHLLGQVGARNVHAVVTEPHRQVATLSPPDQAALLDADAVWFDHTALAEGAAADAVRSLLARGGIVGAGVCSWGIPFGDVRIADHTPHPEIAYARGLGLLPGCAVVFEPDRYQELLSGTDPRQRLGGLWQRMPKLIGIAVPNDAIAIVRGSEVEAGGDAPVRIHTPRDAHLVPLDPIVVEPGTRYDLITGARR